MANEEQLSILKQGVEVWNKWRDKYNNSRYIAPSDFTEFHFDVNLADANLKDASLSGFSLFRVDLNGANLSQANLSKSDLRASSLRYANLSGANLSDADLSTTDLMAADLSEADLRRAKLVGANFKNANLSKADLSNTNLALVRFSGVDFRKATLVGSNFAGAHVAYANFRNIDLSVAAGLDEVKHGGPSSISTDTFVLSKGKIPQVFLRGCGLPDWEIEGVRLHNPDLSNDEVNKILYRMYDLRASQALQISPLFISYSHGDAIFVDMIEKQLNSKGIRFWRDIHDMKSGRIEKQIDQAISQNRTVLLVLSENSLKSDWVEHEVRTARGLEKETSRDVLCPVALDDSWKDSRWPKRVMEQIMEYNILDFSAWEDDVKFEGMFRKLIDGLELFYKG